MGNSYSSDFGSAIRGAKITESHFGANSVGTVNFSIEGGPFDQIVDALGITHLRYPGGTVTEEQIEPGSNLWHGLLDNSNLGFVETSGGERIQTFASMLNYADQADVSVTFVLPSNFLLGTGEVGTRTPDIGAIEDAIDDLSDFLRANPNGAHLTMIEIGNEYYYDGRMTAAEYANLVNEVVPRLDAALSDLGQDIHQTTGFVPPEIAVQAGAGWQPGDNGLILSTLSAEAKAAIDAVVVHYYPQSLEAIGNFGRHLSQIAAWEADPAVGDVRYFASEWNIQNSAESDQGLLQANSLIHAFEEMVVSGVDVASVWGTQYRTLDSRLATLSQRDTGDEAAASIDTNLTSAGEMFLVMRETLVGLHSVDIDVDNFLDQGGDGSNSTELNEAFATFGSEDRFVAFGANRDMSESIDVTLDLDEYFGTGGHVSVRIFIPTDDPDTSRWDEGQGGMPQAIPDMLYVYSGEIPISDIQLALPPGALIIVDVNLGGDGVWLEGQDPVSDRDFINYDDEINGSGGDDTILGHSGNDLLQGEEGRDILVGGAEDDTVHGGADGDLLIDSSGDDQLFGGNGNDTIVDSDGDDQLDAGEGDDLIIAHQGHNIIHGGAGADTIWLAGGTNEVYGGEGANTYVVTGGSENTLRDFNPSAGQTIDLSYYGFSHEEIDQLVSSAFSVADESGAVTLQISEETSLTVEGEELTEEAVRTSIVGGGEVNEFGDLVADHLNDMPFDMISALSGALPSEVMTPLLEDGADSTFLQALEPQALPPFILGLTPEEISEITTTLGPTAVLDGISALQEGDLEDFLTQADDEQLNAFLHDIPSADLTDWWNGLSSDLQNAFEGDLYDAGLQLDGDDGLNPGDPDGTGGWEPDFPIPVLPPVPDPDEPEEDEIGDVEASGDCYVATVVYGGMEHPDVWMLRWFRDEVLRHSILGRAFVCLYWIIGPRMARGFARTPLIRRILRVLTHLTVHAISAVTGRAIGRQPDHRPWPENRMLSFRLVQNTRRDRLRPTQRAFPCYGLNMGRSRPMPGCAPRLHGTLFDQASPRASIRDAVGHTDQRTRKEV